MQSAYSTAPADWANKICSRICLSKEELACHEVAWQQIIKDLFYKKSFQQQSTGNSCHFCDKEYGSTTGLRVDRSNVNGKHIDFFCQICNRVSKGHTRVEESHVLPKMLLVNWRYALLLWSGSHYIYKNVWLNYKDTLCLYNLIKILQVSW